MLAIGPLISSQTIGKINRGDVVVVYRVRELPNDTVQVDLVLPNGQLQRVMSMTHQTFWATFYTEESYQSFMEMKLLFNDPQEKMYDPKNLLDEPSRV